MRTPLLCLVMSVMLMTSFSACKKDTQEEKIGSVKSSIWYGIYDLLKVGNRQQECVLYFASESEAQLYKTPITDNIRQETSKSSYSYRLDYPSMVVTSNNQNTNSSFLDRNTLSFQIPSNITLRRFPLVGSSWEAITEENNQKAISTLFFKSETEIEFSAVLYTGGVGETQLNTTATYAFDYPSIPVFLADQNVELVFQDFNSIKLIPKNTPTNSLVLKRK